MSFSRKWVNVMEYRHVYFRIDSQYDFDSYWPDEEAKSLFREESRGLFQKAGWKIQPGKNGVCDTVTKDKQELHLHPMQFEGIIRMDEVPHIEKLLGEAQNFRCRNVDCYKEYFDLCDEEYLAMLESKREVIREEILKRCQTKRKNLYVTGPVVEAIAKKFSIPRVCDRWNKHDMANSFVKALMDQLIQNGYLKTSETRYGPGFRSATRQELEEIFYEQEGNCPERQTMLQ